MAVFGLVHGAWHGPWCWDRLTPVLVDRGHSVLAPELPIDQPATFDDLADAALQGLAGAPADVVLVGHSLGSMVIPLVAARRPVGRLVFLCGVLPHLGGKRPWHDAPEMETPGISDGLLRDEAGVLRWPSAAAATAAFYASCTDEDAAWATSHLRGQDSTHLWDRPYPLSALPAVPMSSIGAEEDRIVSAEFTRVVSRARLGVEAVILPGDHSPMIGRPEQLADALEACL